MKTHVTCTDAECPSSKPIQSAIRIAIHVAGNGDLGPKRGTAFCAVACKVALAAKRSSGARSH